MKHLFVTLLCVFIFTVGSGLAAPQTSEKRVISYAQTIRVSTLERGLPARSVERWLRSLVGPKANISWESNDCGEQTGSPINNRSDLPTCAEVQATLEDGRKVGISIGVGTTQRGLQGKPKVFNIYLDDHGAVKTLKNLRELSSLLTQR